MSRSFLDGSTWVENKDFLNYPGLEYLFYTKIKPMIKSSDASVYEQINNMIISETDVDIKINPDIIFYDTPTDINITSKISTLGEINEHAIKRNSTTIASSTNSLINYTDSQLTVKADRTYTTVGTINGTEKSSSVTLYVVKPIYYGMGNTINDAMLEQVPEPKIGPEGLYTITPDQAGKYIFISIPLNMNINTIKLNGFEVPFNDPVNDPRINGNKYYMSKNTYDAVTLTLEVL